MKHNERALPVLDQQLLDRIFRHVYSEDASDITEKELRDLVGVLLAMQKYNYGYRSTEYVQLFPMFEGTVGPMEKNSEGTDMWLALGLAIKELYGLRRTTLESLLKKVTVRQ